MQRRDLFRILGGALAAENLPAQHEHHASLAALNVHSYQPRFFSAPEYKVVEELCEILLPSDDSPGARQAGVGYYLDTVLLYADAKRQSAWRVGVQQVEQAAARMFDKPFSACSPEQQTEIMTKMAENEGHPQDALQHFFAILKPAAIEAFCLSDAGMRDYLHYRGNQVLAEFPGCRLTDHHSGSTGQ